MNVYVLSRFYAGGTTREIEGVFATMEAAKTRAEDMYGTADWERHDSHGVYWTSGYAVKFTIEEFELRDK